MTNNESTQQQIHPARFESTQWSLVMTAQHRSSAEGQLAFSRLCEKYWYPLYAHAKRLEPDSHAAKDLTQGFFEKVMERNYIADVDPARGRFRTFLLTSFTNYIANEWDKANAIKRGGSRTRLSLHWDDGDRRYSREPVDITTAEKVFDRRWAETVLASVLDQLEKEYETSDRGRLFTELKQFLVVGPNDHYGIVAERLEMSEGAVKVAVHRLRGRYRERLTKEITETTSSAAEVDDEIRCLFDAFST